MNREFLLVVAGGLVSLVTTLLTLFFADFVQRRREALKILAAKAMPNPESNVFKRADFFKGETREGDQKTGAPKPDAAPAPLSANATDSSIIRKSEN